MLADFNHIFILIFFASLLLLAHLNDIKVKNFTLKAICIFLISLSLLFLLSNECFKGIENEVENINDEEKCVPRIFVECKTFTVYKDPFQPIVTICKNKISNKKIYEYVQD
ncbi:hypothetical protein [Nostoc sp.]|uniref:hypothetical protein n=1 Tax=Nostoc sp. TaxID=1180 RepID=UPI002FF4CBD4